MIASGASAQGGDVVPSTLVEEYDGLILDADGVLFRGARPIEHAAESLATVRSQFSTRLCVVTNNASQSPQAVAAHLGEVGVPLAADEVITSPQGAVAYLREQGIADGAPVFVVGGPGIDDALRTGGFGPTRDPRADVAAVVQGFGPDIAWRDLAHAAYVVARGVLWVATNADLTLPTAEGLAPGNGSLVQAVANAAGRMPDAVTGKPEPLLLELAATRLGAARPLIVGDRIDTDIRGGNAAGMDTMLVLTGVTGDTELRDLHSAAPADRPTYLARDLRALLQPSARTRIAEGQPSQDSDGLARVRHSLAQAWAH